MVKIGVKQEVDHLGLAVKFLDIRNIWLGKGRVFFTLFRFFDLSVAFRFVICG